MERPLATPRHRSKWRYTNSRRLQAVRVILTIVVSIGSIVLLALGIAAWSLPETEDRRARIPLGRYGREDEVSSLIGWLASEDGGYVTGQNWRIDGGLTRGV